MGTTRIAVKKVLRRAGIIDHYFGNRYSFSPYRACAHACLYCDGRAEKYYVEGNFNTDIIIRGNLMERLEKELPLLREKGFILTGSGVTDAYQPVEKEEKLMTRAAECLINKNFPVVVITKSVLPLRDLEKWNTLNKKAGFILIQTLCTLNDGERLIFEPGAPPVEERLRQLETFKSAGIPTAVTAMPLLPLLWDSQQHLEALFTMLKPRVDYILPGSLTLRPGIQKETFMTTLAGRYPELLKEYTRIYGENRQSGAPLLSYQKEVYSRVFQVLTDLGIPYQMPHRLFRDRISLVDEIHILLRHLEELYRPRGIDTRPVREAEKRYTAWITPLRKEFNRKRSLPPEWLDQKLINLAETKGLVPIFDNQKLNAFMTRVIREPVVFDYNLLSLLPGTPRKSPDERGSQLYII